MSQEYDEATYGDRIAEIYDSLYPDAPAEAVAALKELAGAGPALELGIGTGRLALPLAEQGIEVHGIDSSAAIVVKLASKAGGDRIPVTIGNFADVGVSGKYSLVFVAFNTFFVLSNQDEQVQCFANVAKRLRQGGLFLIEAFVPDLTRYATDEQIVKVSRMGVNEVILETSRHDRLNQRIMAQLIAINQAGMNLYPIQARYAWPSELDLMAQMAGMRLRERWSNWRRDPFVAASTNHISIYELR